MPTAYLVGWLPTLMDCPTDLAQITISLRNVHDMNFY